MGGFGSGCPYQKGLNVYISVLLSAIFLVLVGVLVYFALGLLTGN